MVNEVKKLLEGSTPIIISNGVLYTPQPKATMSSYIDQIRKELEEELMTKQASQKFIMEFGKNIGFFTMNNWKVLLDTIDGDLIGIIGLKIPGGTIDDRIYCPPSWCIAMIDTKANNGSSPIVGIKVLMRHKEISTHSIMESYLKMLMNVNCGMHYEMRGLSFSGYHPHAYENGGLCSGSYRYPNTFDIDTLVSFIKTFASDWLSYNPSSPVTRIDECAPSEYLYELYKSSNPPTDQEMTMIAYVDNIIHHTGGHDNRFADAMTNKPTKKMFELMEKRFDLSFEKFTEPSYNNGLAWQAMKTKIKEACK